MNISLDSPKLINEGKGGLSFNILISEPKPEFSPEFSLVAVILGFRLLGGFIEPPTLKVGSGKHPTWMTLFYAREWLATLIYDAVQKVDWPEKKSVAPLFPPDIACSRMLLDRNVAAKVFPSLVR